MAREITEVWVYVPPLAPDNVVVKVEPFAGLPASFQQHVIRVPVLTDADTAVLKAADAYEKHMGKWYDYQKSRGEEGDNKHGDRIIRAVRAHKKRRVAREKPTAEEVLQEFGAVCANESEERMAEEIVNLRTKLTTCEGQLQKETARLDWLQDNSQVFASAIEMDHNARLGDSSDLRAAIDEGMQG